MGLKINLEGKTSTEPDGYLAAGFQRDRGPEGASKDLGLSN